ncbi:MAG: DUF7573 domain-containing protein [Halobacteriota archaeon]
MGRDRSLEEFFESDEPTEEADEPTEEADEPIGDDTAGAECPDASIGSNESEDGSSDLAASIEPITGTYRWSPDGQACAACGATVDRRWREGDAFVCAACKEW